MNKTNQELHDEMEEVIADVRARLAGRSVTSYRPVSSSRLLNVAREKHRNDQDFARWVQRMVDAGWRFWLGVNGEKEIMWHHADEYDAAIGIQDSRRYFLANEIPDPYAILKSIRVTG